MIYGFYLFLVGLCCGDVLLLTQGTSSWDRKHGVFFSMGIGILYVFSLLFFLRGPGSSAMVPYFILFFGVPLYLSFRQRLFVVSAVKQDPKLLLMSDALKVLISGMYTLFALTLIVKILFRGIFPDGSMSLLESLLGTVGTSLAFLFFIVRASRRFPEEGVLPRLGLIFNRRPMIQIILFPVFLGFLFASVTSFLAVMRPVNPQTPLSQVLRETHLELVIAVFVFFAIFFAPVIEEIVFRGYFFKVIKKVKNVSFSIIIVSLVFGLLHVNQYWGDWLAILVVFLLGISLTLVRAYTGSTLASVCMHFTYNLCVTLVPVLLLLILNPAYMKYQMNYETLTLQEKKHLLQKSIKNVPFIGDVYNDLAWVYFEEGEQLEKALQYVEDALSYDQENTAYLDTKMRILKKMGQFQEAKGIFQRIKDRYDGFEKR